MVAHQIDDVFFVGLRLGQLQLRIRIGRVKNVRDYPANHGERVNVVRIHGDHFVTNGIEIVPVLLRVVGMQELVINRLFVIAGGVIYKKCGAELDFCVGVGISWWRTTPCSRPALSDLPEEPPGLPASARAGS